MRVAIMVSSYLAPKTDRYDATLKRLSAWLPAHWAAKPIVRRAWSMSLYEEQVQVSLGEASWRCDISRCMAV